MNTKDELMATIERQQKEINALENTLQEFGWDNVYEDCLFTFNRYLFDKVQQVMPREQFKRLVMETVVEMYKHMDDFMAEAIAHDMQERVKFHMHEVDDLRNNVNDDDIPF